ARINRAFGSAADRNLVHVEHPWRCAVHGAPRSQGHDRNRAWHTQRKEPSAVYGVDCYVHLGIVSIAYLFADVQHGSFVLLPLTDNHYTVHVNTSQGGAHRIHGGSVRTILVAPAQPTSGGDGRGFCYAHKFKGEITLHLLNHCCSPLN